MLNSIPPGFRTLDGIQASTKSTRRRLGLLRYVWLVVRQSWLRRDTFMQQVRWAIHLSGPVFIFPVASRQVYRGGNQGKHELESLSSKEPLSDG